MARCISLDASIEVNPCEELEQGNILFFPKSPLSFSEEEMAFLRAQRQTGSTKRKNIAYKPGRNQVTNFVRGKEKEAEKLLEVMRAFSERSIACLSKLFAPYAPHWQVDYASFRPFQEQGRRLRTRARNDLLHIDAFPSRPMDGKRILRFFININPTEHRRWRTSLPFQELARQYGGVKRGVPLRPTWGDRFLSAAKKTMKAMGIPLVMRSPYDAFMLRMHNFLKENGDFQASCPKDHWEFPPGSSWAVFTDQVSHAVLGGQYALEQTILVPHSALLHPKDSPLGILEAMAGQKMTR